MQVWNPIKKTKNTFWKYKTQILCLIRKKKKVHGLQKFLPSKITFWNWNSKFHFQNVLLTKSMVRKWVSKWTQGMFNNLFFNHTFLLKTYFKNEVSRLKILQTVFFFFFYRTENLGFVFQNVFFFFQMEFQRAYNDVSFWNFTYV